LLPGRKLTDLIMDETGVLKKRDKSVRLDGNLAEYTEKRIACMQAQRFFVEHSVRESKKILWA